MNAHRYHKQNKNPLPREDSDTSYRQSAVAPAEFRKKNTSPSLFSKYLAYLRTQDVHTQRIHAFSISGIITFGILLTVLQFRYDIFSLHTSDVYDNSITYEEKVIKPKEPTSTTTAQSFSLFYQELVSRIQNLQTSTNKVFSSTQTFEQK